MLHVYLCEDNEVQQAYIAKQIENTIMIEQFDMEMKLATKQPEEILQTIELTGNTGLYFLDIDLHSSMNGLQLAQKIRTIDPRGFICFITSHSEMCYMTFTYKVEAMDFILKDNYDEMKSRIHQCIAKANELQLSFAKKNPKMFSIKVGDAYISVDEEEIQFLETSNNNHKIILHASNRIVEFVGNLKEIEKELSDSFYRCHRSYLVNCNNIIRIQKAEGLIQMKNGETCLLSFRCVKGLMEARKIS